MSFFLFIFSMIFFSTNLHSQTRTAKFEEFPKEILEQIDKMGIDESSMLTKIEADYFNVFFQYSKKDFDFCGKKMAFLSGGLGKVIINKKTYFEDERINLHCNNSPFFAFLYIFNEIQKKETNGYDVAIVILSKKRLSIESVVKTLKEVEKKKKYKNSKRP